MIHIITLNNSVRENYLKFYFCMIYNIHSKNFEKKNIVYLDINYLSRVLRLSRKYMNRTDIRPVDPNEPLLFRHLVSTVTRTLAPPVDPNEPLLFRPSVTTVTRTPAPPVDPNEPLLFRPLVTTVTRTPAPPVDPMETPRCGNE